MFVTYRGSVLGIVNWQWRHLLLFSVSGVVAVLLHRYLPAFATHFGLGDYLPTSGEQIALPTLPLAVVGGAIGIFVSFRTNSAYDRWWEGRKLWGRLINTSRHFASQLLTYLPADRADGEPSELSKTMVRRHIAYVHALRVLLRKQSLTSDDDLAPYGDVVDLEALARSSNATHTILHAQLEELQGLVREGRLDLFHQQLLDESLRHLLDIQGGCERIKKTPFPGGYAFIAGRLILAFGILLPLGLVEDMGWLAVPMSVLVCSGFLLIGEVGRVLEDPFTMFWPALPLSALSRTIEVNLRERLGDADLPPMLTPNAKGILM